MTALVILIGTILAILYSALTGTTYLALGMTVYIAVFAIGLASACVYAIRSRQRRSIVGAGLLVIAFFAAHWAWEQPNPILILTLLNLAVAAWFILGGQTRWELLIGALSLVGVVLGVLTEIGIISDHLNRPSGYIAFAFPDIASILGLFSSAVLGIGAGDSGTRVKNAVWVKPRIAAVWGSAFQALRQRIAPLR